MLVSSLSRQLHPSFLVYMIYLENILYKLQLNPYLSDPNDVKDQGS